MGFLPPLCSQYILNGSARQNSCNCYTLTPTTTFQSGSVWNGNKISLRNSFDFWFNVFLGCNDASGADGMVFILQPLSTNLGASGGGMGFDGIVPSIGIALDTWQNTIYNDPAYDHISIQANGAVSHTTDLAGPVPLSATSDNAEDCQWHRLRITWDAATQWLRAYFDGVLRVEKQVDLVASVFNNDPAVFWGFTGATGSSVNLQQFCTALNPLYTINAVNDVACEGMPVVFNNASESFAPITSYNWSFGDGTSSTDANPPHTYAAPGTYTVNLKIKGQDGCEKDSSRTLTVAPNPQASLQAFDTCFGFLPRYLLQAPATGTTTQWRVNSGTAATTAAAVLAGLTPGKYSLEAVVSSAYGCGNPARSVVEFTVKPVPDVAALVKDGCVDVPVLLEGKQVDSLTTVQSWTWRVGTTDFSGRVVRRTFSAPGSYPVKLWAVADNGCVTDTLKKTVRVSEAVLLARDTTLIRNMPARVYLQTNGVVSWTPARGLSDPTAADPVVTLDKDQRYVVTAVTPEGCTAVDTVLIKVFNGPAVYVPTGFTPNGDGRNDRLLPVYVGIKTLKQFAVFNRWGQQVFATTDMLKGWEGSGVTGTYVWLVNAVTDAGQSLFLKGTVTVIR